MNSIRVSFPKINVLFSIKKKIHRKPSPSLHSASSALDILYFEVKVQSLFCMSFVYKIFLGFRSVFKLIRFWYGFKDKKWWFKKRNVGLIYHIAIFELIVQQAIVISILNFVRVYFRNYGIKCYFDLTKIESKSNTRKRVKFCKSKKKIQEFWKSQW